MATVPTLQASLDALRASVEEKQKAVQTLRLASLASRYELRVEERACLARAAALRQQLDTSTPDSNRALAPLVAGRENWQRSMEEAARESADAGIQQANAWRELSGVCSQLDDAVVSVEAKAELAAASLERAWAQQSLPDGATVAAVEARELAELQRARADAEAELKALKETDGEAAMEARKKMNAQLREELEKLRAARTVTLERVEALRARVLGAAA